MNQQETHLKRGENGERDSQGRFLPGWSGGPGRPPKAAEESYIGAFRRAITAEDLTKIVSKLKELALAGDVPAARLLLDRCAPAEQIINQRVEEVARGDDGEWEDLSGIPEELLLQVLKQGAKVRGLDISPLDEKLQRAFVRASATVQT